MYTIGQVSELFGIPISTLRYYNKEGLFPEMERTGGIRRFGERELEALRVIECLKKSGLEIKDIQRFMGWCRQGSSTYAQRRELFARQERMVEGELRHLEQTLAMIRFKCWYYDQAMADGSEDRLRAMIPQGLPPEIRQLYDLAHQEKDSGEDTEMSQEDIP